MAYRQYSGRSASQRPSVPTSPISVTLIQEAEGQTVPPGTLLNSPAPAQDMWLVDTGRKLPGEFWRQLDIRASFYSRDTLDDFDWFNAEVGWRVFGSQQQIAEHLAKAGHKATFYTLADAREERARQKREAEAKKLAEAEAKAQRDAAYADEARTITAMLRGIRKPTREEYDAAWAQICQARGNQWNVAPAELVYERKTEGDYRLPAMPGNDGGYLGFTHIYRVQFATGARLVVWNGTTSGDMGPSIQGIEITDTDADLLADYERRNQIIGYRFDPALYQMMVAADAAGTLSEYGKGSYFGGTPTPCYSLPEPERASTKGAYSHEHNKTAQEVREDLAKRFAKAGHTDALAILAREDSVTEIRAGAAA